MSFSNPYAVWFFGALIIAVLACLFTTAHHVRRDRSMIKAAAVACWSFMTTFVGFLILLYMIGVKAVTIVNSQSLIVDSTGAIKESIPDGIVLWKWDPRLKDSRIVSYNRQVVNVYMQGEHLQRGEEIRVYSFSIDFVALGSPEAYRTMHDLAKDLDMREWLEKMSHEFVIEMQEGLWRFDDSDNIFQQMEFSDFTKKYYRDKLAGSCVEFRAASFLVQRSRLHDDDLASRRVV